MPDKKEKPMTIDDLVSDEDIARNLKAYDTHMAAETQHRLFNEIFAPAMDEFYTALKAQLDAAFKDSGKDTVKVKDKMPEVRKAIVEALKKYFERAMPSALANIKGVKDVNKQFEILAHTYDTHILGAQHGTQLPQGLRTIQEYVSSLEHDEEATVSQIKEELYQQKSAHAVIARGYINQQKQLQYIVPIPAPRLSQHLRPKVEETHTIEDGVKYGMLSHGEMLSLREALNTGSWPQQTPGPMHYGLKAKEAPKK